MKTLKTIIGIAMFALIAILTGCSDQLISTNDYGSTGEGHKNSPRYPVVEEIGKNVPTNFVFRTQIRLKPNKSYMFDAGNTPFSKFTDYDVDIVVDQDVDRLSLDCKDLRITSNIQKDKQIILGCHEKNVSCTDLTIQNLSSNFVDLNVVITGVRKQINYPVSNE